MLQTAAAGNIAAVMMRSYAFSMSYKIRYFRDGKRYADVYWDGTLPETRETARRGIKRNRAEYATILDLDRDAKPIETLHPN